MHNQSFKISNHEKISEFVSDNLIKYIPGYLIAASKKSKSTFFRHPKSKPPHAFDTTKCGKKRMWGF